jgi:hypothetical protein
VVLVAGLGYAVYATVTTTGSRERHVAPTDANGSTVSVGRPGRDAVAARPMLPVAPEDARPTTPAAVPAPLLVVPLPTRAGPVGVPTGFPRTPEGAVGQLGAITSTVLRTMSISSATAVHDGWALPGGVAASRWELTGHVQAFLGAARMGQSLDAAATVVAYPAAGQVKGVDGPGWVLACVLLEVRATITVEARMGYGHCAPMQWHQGRWMIAAGTPAARAPSTWPGSEVAARAGWRAWADSGAG